MSLTDLLIKKLKVPLEGQKTYFDGVQKGFGVRVSKGGAKTFVLVHGKKRKIHSLGRYPDLSLAEARRKAKEVLGKVVAEEKGEMPSLSFEEVRERFLADSAHRTKSSTHAEHTRLLTKHFTFTKNVGAITLADIMDAIKDVRHHQSLEQHCYVAIRTLMNWAVRHGYLAASPVPSMRYSAPSRTRVLTDEELRAVWHRAEEVGYPYGTIIKLLILTGQRRGEIAGLRRSWITDDAITFPAGFTKNKREHKIPIGPLTKDIIAAIPGTTDLLFPARGAEKQQLPFNGWSKSKAEFDKPLGIPEWTLHDLRRTYSSNLAKLGVPIHVTERLLNHVSGTISGVAAVYNRHSYWEEMREVVATCAEQFIGSMKTSSGNRQTAYDHA